MSKHVGLGISLKNCKRSKEIITYLNNLGHSIRTETNWAFKIIKNDHGFATLQSNIEKAESGN